MSEQEPLLRVVQGAPTAEELAALVSVLIARSRPAGPSTPAETPLWVRSSRPGLVAPSGLPTRPGPAAWRLSALPR